MPPCVTAAFSASFGPHSIFKPHFLATDLQGEFVSQSSTTLRLSLAMSICPFVGLFLGRDSPAVGQALIHEFSRSHSDAPQSVALPWTSDQLVAETST